jgi:organic radical activating enzyme
MMVHNLKNGTLLPLMEEFYTIQGEGYHAGRAAYFIRLGGCDVGCHWCDVKESWDATLHPLVAVDDLVKRVEKYPAKLVVITGGEPLMYRLDYLTLELQKRGIQTFIETSGAYPLSGYWDWICLSPKKFKSPESAIHPLANELKVIVFNQSDFRWAETHAEQVPLSCKLYLQPEWSKASLVVPLIIDYVKKNPKWKISLQIHKFLDVP